MTRSQCRISAFKRSIAFVVRVRVLIRWRASTLVASSNASSRCSLPLELVLEISRSFALITCVLFVDLLLQRLYERVLDFAAISFRRSIQYVLHQVDLTSLLGHALKMLTNSTRINRHGGRF